MAEVVYFYPQGHQAHFQPGHPERPERVERIRQGLQERQLWKEYSQLEPLPVQDPILTGVHDPGYLDQLQRACAEGQPLDMDTYTTTESWRLALQAAGGGMAAVDAVWEGEGKVGMALTRPPGHHATATRGMGFCLLNNVALAAEYLIQEKGAERVAIVDIDLHHGNGTQDIFYERGDVFYLSTHQSPFYPGTGDWREKGTGEGEGTTVNIPLPAGTGDHAFQALSEEVIQPLLYRYHPDILLISYGFDTHWRDPIGGFQLSASRIAGLVQELYTFAVDACRGRCVIFLEGGYDLEAGKLSTQGMVSALVDAAWQDTLGPASSPENEGWKDVVEKLKAEWSI